ncbi:MAG: hypothetical protein QF704_13385, partial [Anaerolineales bacterium]|nr:hypothetical protein [Anaerolineales bacterium]
DGSTITEKKKVPLKETDNSGSAYFSFTKVNETVYALAYQGKGADGYISTIKISLDGGTVTEEKTIKHEATQNSWNSLIQIRPNTVMLAYTGVADDGYIKTFTIPTDGSDITPVVSLEHNRSNALYNDLTQIDSDTYLLTYYNENNWGVMRSFSSEFETSEVDPEISTIKLHSDNTKIDVTYNEPVYTATGATTALVAGDFKFSITGGTAKLASATPSSISKSSNTYTLGLSLTGTPDGREILTVTPAAADAIYDANDNAAGVDHLRNSVNLHDKTIPTILSIINNQNESLNVDFSEPVFRSISNITNLYNSDFTLSITGGTATLSATSPSSVTGEGGYGGKEAKGSKIKLFIQSRLTGIPNGEEKISVLPSSGTVIYDMYGNPLSLTQKNNVAPLSQSKILNLGQLQYSKDASLGRHSALAH